MTCNFYLPCLRGHGKVSQHPAPWSLKTFPDHRCTRKFGNGFHRYRQQTCEACNACNDRQPPVFSFIHQIVD
jgi:hypothetical protein